MSEARSSFDLLRAGEAWHTDTLGDRLTVRQAALGGPLGYFDERTGEVVIEEDQPLAGKHIILLHELLHCASASMLRQGIIKRRPHEAWIENLSPNLLILLVALGLWPGLTLEDLSELYGHECEATDEVTAPEPTPESEE